MAGGERLSVSRVGDHRWVRRSHGQAERSPPALTLFSQEEERKSTNSLCQEPELVDKIMMVPLALPAFLADYSGAPMVPNVRCASLACRIIVT
jgi:hypothetical protein